MILSLKAKPTDGQADVVSHCPLPQAFYKAILPLVTGCYSKEI
jgi:hypothetical protein